MILNLGKRFENKGPKGSINHILRVQRSEKGGFVAQKGETLDLKYSERAPILKTHGQFTIRSSDILKSF